MENLSDRLVDKSIEAFILGLEVYNKPTIRYRIEGFSFFVVNAWELMLKAEILNRGGSIYYRNKPDRTISVSETIKRVYSDKETRIRLNLEKIVELRNLSTHLITEDYEVKYAPLFQACVLNYVNELSRFHKRDITNYISQGFLTITTRIEDLTNEQIKIKYPSEIAERLIQQFNEVDVLRDEYDSDKFAVDIRQNLYITKHRREADFVVSLSSDSKNKVAKIKELKDPSDTHKYSYKNVISVVKSRLDKKSIKLGYSKGFNTYVLSLIIDFYNIKEDIRYAYKHSIGNSDQYTYSQQFIDFIISEIQKNPKNFVESLKKSK